DHVQRAGVAGGNQRQHGVGHAQAGADDGYGLLGIRERVDALGGSFELSPVENGMRAVARLPL
ncbi:MAG: histidine kinase, partial [Starkeya sp.]|nr:histidine kinase [Starkeya sp.]